MTTLQNFEPDWLSPPGDTIEGLLEERLMTQADLAGRLGVSPKHLNRIVKGAAHISPEVALGLEKVLGASTAFWLRRDADYQAALARRGDRELLARHADWAKLFPLAELRRRGRIRATERDPSQLVYELLSFFGAARPEQLSDPAIAYRRSVKFEAEDGALSSWLREGELQAAEIECAPFDAARFTEVLQEIRGLTRDEPSVWWPATQELAASAGVAVVVVKEYPKSRVNGATRWLSPTKALIQLSLRYRWEDVFWFTFFHEAGHVLLHRKKHLFVESTGAAQSGDEQMRREEAEADRFAARTLIPATFERGLKTLQVPDVADFARRIGVAPAIVVGRCQHEKLWPYNRGNHLRRRLRLEDES